jgi:hypothetical protein
MASTVRQAPFVEAAQGVRQNAKWLIAAFAAVGAALAAGIQISNLGGIHSCGRLTLAGVAAVLGFLGIALAIWQTSKVLELQEAPTSELVDNEKLNERIRKERTSLGGFGHDSASDLVADYDGALTEFRDAQRAAWSSPGSKAATSRLNSAESEFNELDSIVDYLRTFVIYDKTLAAYTAARCWILLGAVLAFLGLGFFAYAANPSAPADRPEETKVIVRPEPGSRGPVGPRGTRGPRGLRGPKGEQGPPGTIGS